MTDIDQFTQELLNRARNNQHTKYEIIESPDGYYAAIVVRNSLSKIISGFRKTARKVYSDYVDNLKKNIDSVGLLFEYKILTHCVNFYTKEYDNLNCIMEEYASYVLNGHIIDTLLGRPRQ